MNSFSSISFSDFASSSEGGGGTQQQQQQQQQQHYGERKGLENSTDNAVAFVFHNHNPCKFRFLEKEIIFILLTLRTVRVSWRTNPYLLYAPLAIPPNKRCSPTCILVTLCLEKLPKTQKTRKTLSPHMSKACSCMWSKLT